MTRKVEWVERGDTILISTPWGFAARSEIISLCITAPLSETRDKSNAGPWGCGTLVRSSYPGVIQPVALQRETGVVFSVVAESNSAMLGRFVAVVYGSKIYRIRR